MRSFTFALFASTLCLSTLVLAQSDFNSDFGSSEANFDPIASDSSVGSSSSSSSSLVASLLPVSVNGFLQRLRNGEFGFGAPQSEVEPKGIKTVGLLAKKKLLVGAVKTKLAVPLLLKKGKVVALASLLPLKLAAKGALVGGLIAKPILLKAALIGGKKAKIAALTVGKPLLAVGGAAALGTVAKAAIAKKVIGKKVIVGSKVAATHAKLSSVPKVAAVTALGAGSAAVVSSKINSHTVVSEPEVAPIDSFVQQQQQQTEEVSQQNVEQQTSDSVKGRDVSPFASSLAALRRPAMLENQSYDLIR